jgi:hypothetical protein
MENLVARKQLLAAMGAILLGLTFAGAPSAAEPYSLSVPASSVNAGANVTVTWSAPSGSQSKDWVGLFKSGDSNNNFIGGKWTYTNGAAAGSYTTSVPPTGGSYEFRYLLNDGYTDVTRSNAIAVSTYTLSVPVSSVNAGANVTVTWSAPSGSQSKDWVGLYKVGDSNHSFGKWVYTGGLPSGTFTVAVPPTAGSYEFRYLLNDGFTDTARSSAITVTAVQAPVATPASTPAPPPPPPSTKPSLTFNGMSAPVTVVPGGTITINVLNSTGNAKDWIGIYRVGVAAGTTKSVVEHYVAATSYTIPITTPTGTYEARLFANDSLTLLATSAPITVSTGTASPSPTLHPTMTARLLGQTGEDLVGTYSQGADGIKDVHLQLSGVSGTISGVRITGPGLDGIWETPANGQNWIVGIKPQSNSSVVDLYIDFYKPITSYNLTVTFSDGATQALVSTPAPASNPPPPPPPSSCPSNAFYVSTSGNDGNPGTQSAPWRTLAKVSTGLISGETACIMDGTYTEPALYFRQGSGVLQPITMMAQNKGQAILSSTSGCTASINVYASHVVIQDMRLSVSPSEPMPSGCSTANYMIHAWEGNEPTPSNPSSGYVGFVLRGNTIDFSNHRNGSLKTHQDNSLIENNVFHDQLETIVANNIVIRNNTFLAHQRDWSDSIVTKGGTRNVKVYGNLIHVYNDTNAGVELGGTTGNQWLFDPPSGVECYDCEAYGNTVINDHGTNAPLYGFAACKNCMIHDNIGTGGGFFLRSGGLPGSPGSSNPGSVFKNNTINGVLVP